MTCTRTSTAITEGGGGRIRILEEHLNPLPRCERCGSQVPSVSLNTHHYTSESFKHGEEYRCLHKTLQHCFEASRFSLQINAENLPPLEAFTFLGRKIAYNNRNWARVYQNPWKAQRQWGVIVRVIAHTGTTVRPRGMLYKAVAKSALLYGSEIWVVTGEILKVLEGFYHWAKRRITGMTATW